jgi:hypothetical protein
MKTAEPKQRWTKITDDAESAALMQNGKWREDKPTFVRRADGLWVLVNEQFTAWRISFGKRL